VLLTGEIFRNLWKAVRPILKADVVGAGAVSAAITGYGIGVGISPVQQADRPGPL
jgi:hypothetical protein